MYCKEKIEFYMMGQHLVECDMKIIECERCKTNFPNNMLEEHKLICPWNLHSELVCEIC